MGPHLILAASFRSLSLSLLAFDPLNRSLSLVQHVPAFGPHQYIATNPRKDRVYTTTWAQPPSLQSWEVNHREGRIIHINTVPITATSSYISIPPPCTHVYSTGGPTGEVHLLDHTTGGFGKKIQEFLFIPEDQLPTADKSRTALCHGSHAIEFCRSLHLAFVPVLGSDSIETYFHNATTGLLSHLSSTPSPRGSSAHDGPRHVKIHPNGQLVYSVTEHSNYVDIFTLSSSSPHLTFHSSRSIVPSSIRSTHTFRGDTLFLSPSLRALFTTTRGSIPATQGWISVFALDEDGLFASDDGERYQTPTSGGKAHAIDLLPKLPSNDSTLKPYDINSVFRQHPLRPTPADDAVWILLTDDDESTFVNGGGVRVLEWNGWGTGGFNEVAKWPSPSLMTEQAMLGGSHAVWL